MRTKNLFTSAIAAVALLYSSGCSETTNCYYPVRATSYDCNPCQPVVVRQVVARPVISQVSAANCAPAVVHPVVSCQQYVPCAPACPPVKPKKVCKPKRKKVRCARPSEHCFLAIDPCSVPENPPLLFDNCAQPVVAFMPAPAPAPVAVVQPCNVPAVYVKPMPPKPPKERKVRGRTRTIIPVKNNSISVDCAPRTADCVPVAPCPQPQSVSLPIQSIPSPAPVVKSEPVAQLEPVRPAPPRKKKVERIEPELEAPAAIVVTPPPAPVAKAPAPVVSSEVSPTLFDSLRNGSEPAPIASPVAVTPVAVAPAPQVASRAVAVPTPAPIPSPRPMPKSSAPANLEQIPYPPQARQLPPPPPGPAPMPPPAAYGTNQIPLVEPYEGPAMNTVNASCLAPPAAPMPAPVPPPPPAAPAASTYCPPDVCPVPYAPLCEPNQSMSDCFSMNEQQLINSPQVYTPNAMSPLPIQAPVLPVPPTPAESSSKYEALAPVPLPPPPGAVAAPAPRPEARRPELTMPTPLGGDNIPHVPAASEIESALDAMLSRDDGAPSMPGGQSNLK